MKKSLFFIAAAALALTACTNDDDALQTGQVQNSNRAVAFDTYTAGTTRAGDPTGVMTTDKLKTAGKGFGVYAYYHNDDATYGGSQRPDFMFNEHVSWSGGWTYSPLKYWPNETENDSQTDPATSAKLDRLSFFAYAPYVSAGSGETLGTNGATSKLTHAWKNNDGTGIVAITDATETSEPKVQWMVSDNPDNNVDLLWGVAPAGMSYQNVAGSTTSVTAGLPLLNMVKPDKDQKMKFLFLHALSRIGLSVVSAIDQIAAGDDAGNFKESETRVLIKEVKIWGDFGINGVLNLNNTTHHVAKWEDVSKSTSDVDAPLFTINVTNGYLNPVLRYDQTTMLAIQGGTKTIDDLNKGVRPAETDLMVGGPDPSTKVESATPAFEWGKTLYHKVSNDYLPATVSYAFTKGLFTYDGTSKYTQLYKATDSPIDLDASTPELYTITPGTEVASPTSGTKYYKRTGSAGSYTFELITSDGTESGTSTIKYYEASATSRELITANYSTDTYYTALLPRYFMVIPSALSPNVPTNINVKITYVVVTGDNKLVGNMSNIENAITKETSIQLENGKSYNLKLILGLTSVKLAAEVADWQLADDVEINLPKNN